MSVLVFLILLIFVPSFLAALIGWIFQIVCLIFRLAFSVSWIIVFIVMLMVLGSIL